jgi:hypothetical protein
MRGAKNCFQRLNSWQKDINGQRPVHIDFFFRGEGVWVMDTYSM